VVSTTYTKVMRRALEAMGSVQGLADCLQAEKAEVIRWIAGHDQPPEDKFMRAIDIMLAHFTINGAKKAPAE
jgi:hypothetical protein